jgi:shikimate kinase
MVVLLLGLKHSGKSSLGRRAAQELRTRFLDLDEVAAELLRARGESLPQEQVAAAIRRYYLRFGRDAFRALERSAAVCAVRRAKPADGDTAVPPVGLTSICALGGGTPENEAAYKVLQPGSHSIYLRERPELLFERIIAGGVPPFLEGEDPWQAFSMLATRRDSLYRSLADDVFELEGRGIEELLPILMQHIQEYKDGR